MDPRDLSPASTVRLADVSDAPQWLPSPAELDDLELTLAGVDLPVAVRVPSAVADALAGAPGLVLTDPEGTPLALLRPVTGTADAAAAPAAESTESMTRDWHAEQAPAGTAVVTGAVAALQPAEHGPFRRLRLPAAQVRAGAAQVPADAAQVRAGGTQPAAAADPTDGGPYAPPLAVLVDQPLQEAHLKAIASAANGRPVLLLVLAGHGSPQLVDASALIRTTVLSAAMLTGSQVVVVPLARRTDPAAETARRAAVLAAYAGSTDTVSLDSVTGALPVEALRAVLDANQELGPATFAAPVEAIVRQAHRRPDERGVTVLFTGLSGSGKSTIARAFAETVNERFSRTVTLLDGDVVRRMLSAGLTFSKADRELNIRRIGFVAAEINRHGGLAVCCPIAPYASTRADVRAMVEAAGGAFVLVHISTPLAESERRDRKGLYAKARAGLIPEFTGISDPYEEPIDADLAIDTTDVTVADGVERVVELLTRLGYVVPGAVGPTAVSG